VRNVRAQFEQLGSVRVERIANAKLKAMAKAPHDVRTPNVKTSQRIFFSFLAFFLKKGECST
jgi:hypothetical protein